MSAVGDENRGYFDSVYRPRHPLSHLLRARLSWDQQAKSRLNLAVLAPYLARIETSGHALRVLDYGCGWGSLLLALPRSVAAWGYDLSESATANLAATMRLLRREFAVPMVHADGRIEPGGFDVIVCSHVLEHVDDDRAVLAALVRALGPRGFLLVNVPINERFADPKHARRYDETLILERLTEQRMTVLEVHAADRLSGCFDAPALGLEGHGRRTTERLARAVLANLPGPALGAVEALFAYRTAPQQLVVLAKKAREAL